MDRMNNMGNQDKKRSIGMFIINQIVIILTIAFGNAKGLLSSLPAVRLP